MNYEQIQKASHALSTARKEYQRAAKELLAAVEATPSELEKAYKIIDDDIERTGGAVPSESLGFDENVAYTILEEVRD